MDQRVRRWVLGDFMALSDAGCALGIGVSTFLEKLIDTWDFPGGAVVMNLPANAEDSGDVV